MMVRSHESRIAPKRIIFYTYSTLIDVLLNYLKALEYHYRDDVRAKKNPEYNAAMKLFREIGEPVDPNKRYTDYRMKPIEKKK